MAVIYDPCRPGCCKTAFPGICYTRRKCACHRETERRQRVLDEWADEVARTARRRPQAGPTN